MKFYCELRACLVQEDAINFRFFFPGLFHKLLARGRRRSVPGMFTALKESYLHSDRFLCVTKFNQKRNNVRNNGGSHRAKRHRHLVVVLLLNARTQPSFDQTDDGVDAETSLSLSLHLYLSSPPLHFLLTLTFGL